MTDAVPEPGAPAPAFRLPSTAGEVSLDGLLAEGQRLVLAFYVEDGTPSCETELSLLRDAHDTIVELGARVLAVSADSLQSHRAFVERAGGFPFPLASDAALETARAYGVVDEGNPRRSRRAMFVIDRDGTVLLALPHFQPNNLSHIESVLTALGAQTES